MRQSLNLPKEKREIRVTIKLTAHEAVILRYLMGMFGETNMSNLFRRLLHDQHQRLKSTGM